MLCFDLKSDPLYYFNLSIQELKKELNKKPKVIRTIKHKKHPIIMNSSYGINFDNYKQLGIKKLKQRAKMVRENKEFAKLKKRIKRLGMYQTLIEGMKPRDAANFSKGKDWTELDVIMKERGF